MMPEDELQNLREEYRSRQAADMAFLKASTLEIQRDIHLIREQYTRTESYERMDLRVRSLEDYRSKIFGMFIASQVIGGLIVTAISWIIKK